MWLLVTRPLWHDEIFTVWLSRSPLPGLLAALRKDSGPPLYYMLVRPLMAVTELWALPDSLIRLLSFCAVAALTLGLRPLARPAARAWFLALSSTALLLTYYAAEARAYALLALLDFSLFLLLRVKSRGLARTAGIALLAAASLYTHYLGVFFVAAVGLVALLERRHRDAAALAAGSALFLPWIPVLLSQPAAATSWMKDAPIKTISGFLSTLGGVGRLPPAFGIPPPAVLIWAGAIAGTALLVASLSAARRDPELRAGLLVVGIVLAATIAAGAIRPVAFAGRTEMAILPVWIWVVALAASRESSESRLTRGAALAACVLGAAALAMTLPAPRVQPAGPRAAAAIQGLARPEDLVVAATAFYLPARLAHERGTLAAPVQGFPRNIEGHPGWFALAPPADDAYRELAETLRGRPKGTRVWMAIHPIFATPRMAQVLEESGRASEGLRGRDALVLVWTPK